MPCIKELAQFPIPAIAIFIFVISAYSPINTLTLINHSSHETTDSQNFRNLRIYGFKVPEIYEIMIPEITNLPVSQLWILNLLLFVLLLYKSIISNFAPRERNILFAYIYSESTLKFASF